MLASWGGGHAVTSPRTTKDPEQNGETNTVPKESTMGSVKRELAGQRTQEEKPSQLKSQ
jgi:hypothetical protein